MIAQRFRSSRVLSAGLVTLAAGLAIGAFGGPRAHVAAQVEAPSTAAAQTARLLVARAPNVTSDQMAALHAARGMQVVGGIEALGVDFLAPAAPGATGTHREQSMRTSAASYEASPLVRWAEIEQRWHVDGARPTGIAGAHASAATAAAALGPATLPAAADPVTSGRMSSRTSSLMAPDATPNDPRFVAQWHLPKMHVPDAWDIAHADGITIAVVDTGVECSHPDLAAACVPGRNVIDGNADTSDRNMHGTVEAGAAAAVVDNGEGIAGVAWGAKIMPIKAMSDDGSGNTGDIAAGIVWAADNGAQVINLSLGGEGSSQVMEDAVQHAVGRGAFLAASAGNSPTGNAMYPAAYAGVIGVGATTRGDTRPSFGNFGAHVELCAPGVSILTTDLGGTYAPYDGTSESTALASGVAALLLGQQPARTPTELRQLLIDSAVDLGPPGRDDEFGHGRIDAGAALALGAEDEPEPVEPEPQECVRGWTLSLRAFPDVSAHRARSGWPPAPAACPGCDGVHSSADRQHGARAPLGPLRVVISPAAEPAARIAEIEMDGHGTPFGAPETHIALCFPPPYRITLETTDIDGYTLCANSVAEVILSQPHFDRARSSRRGQGRWAEVVWGFQRCGP